jgi:hypothetical protein
MLVWLSYVTPTSCHNGTNSLYCYCIKNIENVSHKSFTSQRNVFYFMSDCTRRADFYKTDTVQFELHIRTVSPRTRTKFSLHLLCTTHHTKLNLNPLSGFGDESYRHAELSTIPSLHWYTRATSQDEFWGNLEYCNPQAEFKNSFQLHTMIATCH